MQQDIRAFLTGGVAGALATAPMTAVMLAGKRLGLVGDVPPQLVANVALGARDEHDPGTFKRRAVATELHLYVGAINGAAYGALANRFGRSLPAPLAGAAFGIVVWLIGYRGWMPMLKIMPPIEKDRPDRQVVLVLSHLVYGATLGMIARKFRG
jgi:uncharacterized membrane protein YagU involved in acid resistance